MLKVTSNTLDNYVFPLAIVKIDAKAVFLLQFHFILFVLISFQYTWLKHVFSYINIRQVPRKMLETETQVPRKMLKTETGGRGFQHLSMDLANVNALKTHVRSLLLHKNWQYLLHFALFLALFSFAFSPMSRVLNFHGLCSF